MSDADAMRQKYRRAHFSGDYPACMNEKFDLEHDKTYAVGERTLPYQLCATYQLER